MSLLVSGSALAARADVAAGPLAPLADALARGLEPLLGREASLVPELKAQLSREGGRCARDGALLQFDPWSPHAHRCPRCGETYTGERHDRHWLYWYHLWLAERVLHASLLWRLRGDPRHRDAALALLDAIADRYAGYPNRDNLLGPSRVFFSTYLESIWLLQLVLASDALAGASNGDSPAVRGTLAGFAARVVEPSVSLIASYEEGASNRQVWNDAAMLAAGALLGDRAQVQRALFGEWGLVAHMRTGLLADGSWYEGENYHLFAHRGLWYGVALAESLGTELPADALARFDAGFTAPLATVLPDLTLPSRRDSQYAISLRQPRFAEMAELGFARTHDARLAGLLHALYSPGETRGETGQATTSADVERNVAPTSLTRADLGWRTLLFGVPSLPETRAFALRSALLPSQGIAVFRRRRGDVYAALDFGRSGGGHGHPDRLNLLLMQGATRWLDDVGTGSYVERTLHWYRSTLAHNAPLVDGRSQHRRDGTLLAHDEREGAGWVVARAEIAPRVTATRTLVMLDGYLLDELRWQADRDVTLDLPLHLHGAEPAASETRHVGASLMGGSGLEDGFEFLTDTRVAPMPDHALHLRASRDGHVLEAFISCDSAAEWWRARTPAAPVAPGVAPASHGELHLLRTRGREGRIRSVWSWTPGAAARFEADATVVSFDDGTTHSHSALQDGGAHRIGIDAGSHSAIVLEGWRAGAQDEQAEPSEPSVPATPPHAQPARAPLATLRARRIPEDWFSELPPAAQAHWFVAELGERHYRRSEQSWREGGEPSSRVALAWTGEVLALDVAFESDESIRLAAADAVNPWDNEHADMDAHGVQLYLRSASGGGGWLLAPEAGGGVRVRPLAGWGSAPPPAVRWRRTQRGFELRAELPLPAPPDTAATPIALDVLVNETARDRARRRGQLVLSGGGDWIYLRGDRHDPARLIPFVLMRDPE